MLAYKTEHIDNSEILRNAKKWNKNKLITDQNYETIKSKYANPLYTPNLFIRIGLFIFTFISAFAAIGLLMLVTNFSGSQSGFRIHCIVDGIILLALLELLVKGKELYKSGIDDALLYMVVGSLVTGFCLLFYNNDLGDSTSMIVNCFIALPFLILFGIRYSDMLLAAVTFVCAFLLIFLLVSKTGESSKYSMPFIVMILSTALYLVLLKFRKLTQFRFWDSSLWILEILSLLIFYLAGNYFVVRTMSEELFGLELNVGEDIPFAFFFYTYTAIVPLVYIFLGLKDKNKVLLQSGLILVVVSVATFKYYYSLGHQEITLTISGIVMIVVAWLSIRYLKVPKFGITYIEDINENTVENFDAEALLTAQTFLNTQSQPGNNTTEFGGGKFGGGGADSSF